MVKWTKQRELMSDLLFTVYQHGGDHVTWNPSIWLKCALLLHCRELLSFNINLRLIFKIWQTLLCFQRDNRAKYRGSERTTVSPSFSFASRVLNPRSGSRFPFRFVITFRRARRNEKQSLILPRNVCLPPTLLIDWHLPNQPTKITSVVCFSSIQIFHAWEKCRLADLKNSFHLLIFSAKNKTVSTITFNFLRD